MAAPATSTYIGWLGPIRFESGAGGTIFPVPSTFMDGSTSILAITSTAVTITDGVTLGWSDVSLSRGAANRLDLGAGDSFRIVSGGLEFGASASTTGNVRLPSNGDVYWRNAANNADLRALFVDGADVMVLGNGAARLNFQVGYSFGSNLLASTTAPTVTSAGTSPSVTASNGTAAFRVNVGTGGTATTIVMAMPTASTGWNCFAENITATAANRANQRVVMVSSTTTSITVQNQTISTGAALAFTASDIVAFTCTAF